MSRTLACCVVLIGLATPLVAQTAAPDMKTSAPTLRINSRAVLVDVIVTDRNGKPVTGLKEDAFTVMEQGKPQTISFFEEHAGAPAAAPKEMPKLPPGVFSNFSPFPQPAAVNVLLLDSLNTRMESQSLVHAQALKFLKDLKPGSRMAIFTMGLGLHFVQGFTDDPALLFAALKNKKNNEVQSSVMLKGQEESNAQQNLVGMMSAAEGNGATAASSDMIAALANFFTENDQSRETDRVLLTMENLQRLATFLNGFPGRKNVIWFSESPTIGGRVEPQTEHEWEKTRNMLAAARVALYPVDARGVSTVGLYQADTVLSPSISMASQILGPTGAQSSTVMADASQRDAQQSMMKELADDTGGKAFMNTNGLSDVMAKISADSADFYTVSYTPTNAKMDGASRNIEVKVAGDKFKLSYRRGYFARDAGVPGNAMEIRAQAIQKLAAQNPGAVDPLLPFMDLGMPQSQQILYEVKIQPSAALENKPAQKKDMSHYAVDFAIDLKDLYLNLDAQGLHNGTLNVSLIVYDRYGNIISREDHVAALTIKPDVYAVFQQTGVQLHAELAVPKGNYWLRTGVYDQGSRKVGTMEVALSSVLPLQASMK
jgi:VWFA-related protein